MPVELLTAVESLIAPLAAVPDEVMGRTWVFQEYDEEGVRFALLQTSLELRELAVLIQEARAESHPITTAQRIMAQYHIAYRDLRGALCGVAEADFTREPAADEWSIRRTLQHIIRTPVHFLVAIHYALEQHRRGDYQPIEQADERFEAAADQLTAHYQIGAYDDVSGTVSEVLSRFDALHTATVNELVALSNVELDWPSVWWEGTEKPMRFRLLRFEAHLRQHTVQIEKTRQLLGYSVSEAQWLIRQLYNALGEAEGAAFGVRLSGEVQQMYSAAVATIQARAEQIASLLQG